MSDREPSLGELGDDLRELKLGIAGIHLRLDQLDSRFVRQDVAAEREARRTAEITTLQTTITEMQARVTWAWRAGVTGVLLPIIVTIALVLLSRGGAP